MAGWVQCTENGVSPCLTYFRVVHGAVHVLADLARFTEERCHVLDFCVLERNDAHFRCQAGVSLALLPLLSRFWSRSRIDTLAFASSPLGEGRDVLLS